MNLLYTPYNINFALVSFKLHENHFSEPHNTGWVPQMQATLSVAFPVVHIMENQIVSIQNVAHLYSAVHLDTKLSESELKK